jgi:hypothetical protein
MDTTPSGGGGGGAEPEPQLLGADPDEGAEVAGEEGDAVAAPTGGWGADLMTAARGASGSSMVIEISDPRVSYVPPGYLLPATACRG